MKHRCMGECIPFPEQIRRVRNGEADGLDKFMARLLYGEPDPHMSALTPEEYARRYGVYPGNHG